MNDTICAISTSLGVGAISIIRVSGSEAIAICNSLFKGKNLHNVNSHTINYGFIVDNDVIIDEVLVSVMKAPKTYTTEDIVEINCHGGISSTNKILELVLSAGARLAQPGEFTKRAYLNGRIDLVKAEGISDMISANSESARKLAMNQISGNLSLIIKECRDYILSLLANIEVNIDFPEYEDAEVVTKEMLIKKINIMKNKLKNIIDESENSAIIKKGIDIVFVGQPNVGKSSLLNKFLGKDKAIVTDIAGTTRDVVEGSVIYNGLQLNLIDTAGIHETNDEIEKIGVEKSKKEIKKADLIVIILNNNQELNEKDYQIIDYVQSLNKKYLYFINKTDLSKKIDYDRLDNELIISGNTIDNNGIENLQNAIIKQFNLDNIESKDLNYLSNVRQLSLAKKSLCILENVENSNNNNVPVDLLAIDLKSAWDILGEIIGETYKDELLDELFSKFCLGK